MAVVAEEDGPKYMYEGEFTVEGIQVHVLLHVLVLFDAHDYI